MAIVPVLFVAKSTEIASGEKSPSSWSLAEKALPICSKMALQLARALFLSSASSAEGVARLDDIGILGNGADVAPGAAPEGDTDERGGSAGMGPSQTIGGAPINIEKGIMSSGPGCMAKSRIDIGARVEKPGQAVLGRVRSQLSMRILFNDIVVGNPTEKERQFLSANRALGKNKNYPPT